MKAEKAIIGILQQTLVNLDAVKLDEVSTKSLTLKLEKLYNNIQTTKQQVEASIK